MLAAKRDLSLSALFRSALEEKVRKETGYEAARERQAALLGKGLDLGTKGRLSISREELHDRKKP